MNILLDNHLKVLILLNEHRVKYLLIGGYAVIVHGYSRTTGDMDLWIEPSKENQLNLCKVFKALAFDNRDIDHIKSLDFNEPHVFSIGSAPQKIDFLTKVALVKFKDAFANKISHVINGLSIDIVHLNDLVLMKMNTNRLKDKADIEELQRLNNLKP